MLPLVLGWQSWNSWSPCSQTCGVSSFKERSRVCRDSAFLGGNLCQTREELKATSCDMPDCVQGNCIKLCQKHSFFSSLLILTCIRQLMLMLLYIGLYPFLEKKNYIFFFLQWNCLHFYILITITVILCSFKKNMAIS